MNRNEIRIIHGTEYCEMTKELCRKAELSSHIRRKCGMDGLIALKPNLLGPIPASEGATTHPEVTAGVIEYLKENGFRRIAVMEGSWVGDRTADSLAVTGYGELCEKLEVPFWDLQKDRGVEIDCAGMKIEICERALKADYLINLPVLKGHCQTGMTCALKNMKGCIPNAEKRRFHRMGLFEPIGHLPSGIRQDFVLADAICPDLTFEDGGNPTALNMLLCAFDPVLMDAYGCSVIGIKPEDVPYIRIAAECGVGNADLTKLKVLSFLERKADGKTDYPEDVFDRKREIGGYRSVVRLKEMVSDVDSCSACYGTLLPVLDRLEREGALRHLQEKICIGQGFRGKSGKLGIGNCTCGFERSLKGCPPDTEEMYRFLKEIEGQSAP